MCWARLCQASYPVPVTGLVCVIVILLCVIVFVNTGELECLEHLLKYENMLETGVVQANEC